MSAEMDTLIKTVKDAVDAIKTARSENEESTKRLVEETLKKALSQHPGVTPKRTIQFAGNMPTEQDEIMAEMPKSVQKEMDKIYLLSSVLQTHPKNLKSWKRFQDMFSAEAGEFKKALDSTTAGGVDEWVPTELSPTLVDKIRLQLKVAALFPEIPMPTNPYELPIEVGNFNSFLVPENTADTGQTLIPVGDDASISGKTTFTAKGHKTRILTSKEATEDSIVPLLPFIENRVIMALAQGREDAILNGDTAGSHEDTDISSATARRKLWLGLRAHSNDQSYTRDLSTLSTDNLLELIGDMGVYGINPSETAFVTGIRGMILLAKIDEFKTLDKIGPQAVVLQGMLGMCLGRPVVVSEWVRQDLNASAVYEASATKTVIHLVNRNAFAMGVRRRPSSEFFRELYAASDQNAIMATERVDFEPLYPIASNRAVNTGINVG